ncbi:MAG: tail fiber domain-containing protein [Candidatus Binatus sp.]
MAGESGTIGIGTKGTQTATCITSIFATRLSKSSAKTVLIDSSGHLGVQVSSARYKRDIHDMGEASGGLMKLRPVSFRYKQDPAGTLPRRRWRGSIRSW